MIGLLKYGEPTSQTFHIIDESDTGGVAGVFVDGQLYTGDTLSAANDYTGIVTVTGLSPGTHTWDVALDGVAANNIKTFQTAPEQGEAFKLVIAGDITGNAQCLSRVAGEGARYGIVIGDCAYHDTVPDFGAKCGCANLPEAADPVVFATVLDTYRCKWRCSLTYGTYRQVAFSQHPWDLNWHNHEFETPVFQVMTDPDASAVKYQASKQAADEYLFAGNAPATGNWDTYPNPRVYRDFTIGDAHVLIFDHTSYGWEANSARSFFEGSVADGSGGVNTGSQQLDWAIATMQSSSSKLIILITPAEPVHSSASAAVGGQWETLLGAIDGLAGKTVLLFCGDTHQLLVETLGGSKLPNNPLTVVNATPALHPLRSSASDDWVSNGDAVRHAHSMIEPLQVWKSSRNFYLGSVIFPPVKNGHYYRCVAEGKTGSTEPASWPTTDGQTVVDGAVTWQCMPNKLDAETDFNYNYAIVDVLPNGGKYHKGWHVLVTIKNALTGTPRVTFYIPEGERQPVFVGGKLSGPVR